MDKDVYSSGDLRFSVHAPKRVAVWSGIPWKTHYRLQFDVREARGNWEHADVTFEWDGKEPRELDVLNVVWDIVPNKAVPMRTTDGRNRYIANECLTLEPAQPVSPDI